MIRAAVLTISDRGASGQRPVDASGEAIRAFLREFGAAEADYRVVPDEAAAIEAALRGWADGGQVDLVLTTGGTGLSPRDVTPEATLRVAERQVPGLAETMRAESLKKTPMAMLSRGVAVIRGHTLIVNLPGSPKAVMECLEVIRPVLAHGIEMLGGGGHG